MYVPDLTVMACDVLPDEELPFVVDLATVRLCYIGWLDGSHSYPVGKVSESVFFKIALACLSPVMVTRGYHICPFCPKMTTREEIMGWEPPTVEVNNCSKILGGAEIWVPGSNGIIFRAPNLIYHYIKDHGYVPPGIFLEACEHKGRENQKG